MKHRSILLSVMLLLTTFIYADEAKPQLAYEVEVTNNWVYYAPQTPELNIAVSNPTAATATQTVTLEILTDTRKPLYKFAQKVALNAGAETTLQFTFPVPEPGFYRCIFTEQSDNATATIKRFNIGYEPEAIVSLPDHQPDIRQFWDKALAELAQVAPEYNMTLIPDSSNNVRKLYMVTMKSLGGVEIAGYYSTPAKKGKYPAIIHYMGYGSKPWVPGGTPDMAEFVLSVRGQALLEPVNTYGDWITYGLDNKDNYYYRGAFMDLIRAIDFVSSRPEINKDQIFAEGGSQGGAFTMAACALDNRIRAAAPTITFLSDYRDYFQIVHWPAEPVLKKQKELGISDNDLYTLLSYFDIKNLAGWIKCPIILGVGLQDEVCPPHTNFSGYNRLTTEKEYHIYPHAGHHTGDSWWGLKMDFFKKYMK